MALLTVLPALLLLLLLSASASAAGPAPEGRSVIAVSHSGMMHLDTSGELIAWRRQMSRRWNDWHVATNPRNGTICWVQAHEDYGENAVLRCALIASLNDTWDLPQPPEIRLNWMDALAFDWLNENWHFTASRVSYVCSYVFDRCVVVTKAFTYTEFYAAYDIPNRLLFQIATDRSGRYKLQVLSLDGTGLRELPTNLTYPTSLAVDPVQRHVYILHRPNLTSSIDFEIHQVNYDGENAKMIAARNERFERKVWQRARGRFQFAGSIDVIDGDIFVIWDNQTTVSRVSASDGTVEDLVAGAVRGQMLPALAKVEKLLGLRIVSPETQPEQVQNACEDAGCQHLCIPTAVNGTAGATCFCPEGQDLAELTCYKKYPAYAVVAGADSLQAVDLQTEQVIEILSGLNNVTDLEFFWAGDEEYLLFWLDVSGVSRGSWSPGAVVSDSSIVVPAAENKHILSMAIDWNHRHLIWMERDVTVKSGKSLAVKIASFDGTYVKTVAEKYGKNQSNLILTDSGAVVSYVSFDWGEWFFESFAMDGNRTSASFTHGLLKVQPTAVTVKPRVKPYNWPGREAVFWVNTIANSVEASEQPWQTSMHKLRTVLTHPSLEDAGGLAVLDSRIFWTERSTGRLWTADKRTDEQPRALPVQTGGGALRVLHPWLQPAYATPLCNRQRNGCSHLCVLMKSVHPAGHITGYQGECVCPDSLTLGEDKRTCE